MLSEIKILDNIVCRCLHNTRVTQGTFFTFAEGSAPHSSSLMLKLMLCHQIWFGLHFKNLIIGGLKRQDRNSKLFLFFWTPEGSMMLIMRHYRACKIQESMTTMKKWNMTLTYTYYVNKETEVIPIILWKILFCRCTCEQQLILRNPLNRLQ